MVSLGVLPLAKSFETMFMGSAGSGEYWISLLEGGGDEYGRGVAVDSSGNIIAVGDTTSDGAGSIDRLITKRNSLGTLLWAKTEGYPSNEYGFGVAIDSSDNIIVVGSRTSGSSLTINKYNPSGTVLWQQEFDVGSQNFGRAVAVDSNDDIIICGSSYRNNTTGFDVILAKFRSNGQATSWSRYIASTTNNGDVGFGVAIDSSDNVIVTGRINGFTPMDLLVAKFNTSGTLQWQKTLGNGGRVEGHGVAIDSSDNIIIMGYEGTFILGQRVMTIKLNSSGVLQWKVSLGQAGSINSGKGKGSVAIDSSDNVIITGVTEVYSDLLVAKFNSSGTLQWDKTLGSSSGNVPYGWNGVAVDSSDRVIVTGGLQEPNSTIMDFLVAKLPSDGSGDGTYGGVITYQDANLSSASPSVTLSTSTLTNGLATFVTNTVSIIPADAVIDSKLYPVRA